jgi:hypothetical protein
MTSIAFGQNTVRCSSECSFGRFHFDGKWMHAPLAPVFSKLALATILEKSDLLVDSETNISKSSSKCRRTADSEKLNLSNKKKYPSKVSTPSVVTARSVEV